MGDVKHKSTYQTWQDMKQRCYNRKCPNFKNYGGRGIVVCARWLGGFKYFLEDMGERPSGKTIDRFPDNEITNRPTAAGRQE